MFDGGTVFALATCTGPGLDPVAFNAVLAAAADAFARVVVHGILAAGGAGGYRTYAGIFPSAVQEWRR